MGWELVVKVLDIAVLWDFFENGNPHPRRAGPEALTFGTIPGLIFTFRGKEFLFLRFFLGLGIFTFRGGPRLFLWAGPRSLVMCFQVLPLFMLSIAVIQQNNVVLSFLVC